jgi:hypothetical protein
MTIDASHGSQSQITNRKSQMIETLLSCVTAVSLLVALVAWTQARRTAKRLEQLTQMYWELKYQHGELRVRLQGGGATTAPPEEIPPHVAAPGSAFIPLTALKR